MKIVLPYTPPTINKYIGRTNIWEYQKDKKKIHQDMKIITTGNSPMIKRCNIVITYYFKDKRRHDPSNYDKMVLDSLIEANIIVDDSYEVIQSFTTIGKYDKDNSRTEIDIEILN